MRNPTTSNLKLLTIVLALHDYSSVQGFSTSDKSFRPTAFKPVNQQRQSALLPLHLQPTSTQDDAKRIGSQMSAYSADTTIDYNSERSSASVIPPAQSFLEEFVLPVVMTSFLVTSNTVGAGMLVLPELCTGVGMGISTALFLGLYSMNLLSGLIIAEVAIKQRESSGDDAPSSFKAFAEANVDIEHATDAIAMISIVKNGLVLAFGTMKAADIGADLLGLDPTVLSAAWAAAFAGLVATQSAPKLSKVASMLVMGLFGSFAAILLPGLANVHDPLAVVSLAPQAEDVMGSAMHAAPIILMSFIFQNIIPTAARILDYDRTKVVASLCLGSFIPFLMYMAWCIVVLGGGIDTSSGLDGSLFTMFSLITIAGSHLGSSTSMAEEFDTYFKNKDDDAPVEENARSDDLFSIPAVVAPALMAVGFGHLFSQDLNGLLEIAGAYGSPFLYFALPATMAWTQRSKLPSLPDLVPGKSAPLYVSSAVAVGFVASEIFQSIVSTGSI